MSVFDNQDTSPSTKKKTFFEKFTISTEPLLNKKPVFECKIFFEKKNRITVKYYISIVDNKLILYKDGFRKKKKFLDFTKIYTLKTYLHDRIKRHLDYQFYILMEKSQKHWMFFLEDQNTFNKLLEILKKLCVLINFSSDYEISGFLGKGHFAEVYSVKRRETEKLFAAKIFKKQSDIFQKGKSFILQEIKILKFLPENPYIIKLYEVYEDKDRVIMILEFMEGKDLFKMVKNSQRLTEFQINDIFSQILKGLLFLHFNGIIHRDIKPENILFLSNDEHSIVKIADFSLAEEFSPNKKFDVQCGTPGFMAPEILNGKEYDESVDIFSLGITLYMLFAGKPPFKGKNLKELLDRNKNMRISLKSNEWSHYSKEAKNLLRKMLIKDPDQRITLKGICNSKWMKMHQCKKTEKTLSINIKYDDSELDSHNYKCSVTSFQNYLTKDKQLDKSKTDGLYTNDNLLDDGGSILKKSHGNFSNNLKNTNASSSKETLEATKNSMLQIKCENPSMFGIPMLLENYSVNSFLIYSRSESRSPGTPHQKSSIYSESCAKSQTSHSPLKKTSIDSSEILFLDAMHHNNIINTSSFDEFLKHRSESLIFETKREAIDSKDTLTCDTFETRRFPTDLNLQFIVPNLRSIAFKKKLF